MKVECLGLSFGLVEGNILDLVGVFCKSGGNGSE